MSVASEAMVTVAIEGGVAEVEEGVATTEEEGEEGNIIYCSRGYIGIHRLILEGWDRGFG